MPRITKDPDARKEELIDSAERLFCELGFEQTTVSEIVKKTGVAQGTFYYYFKAKEDILDAVVSRAIDAMASKVIAEYQRDAVTAPQKLQIMLCTVLGSINYMEKLLIGQMYQHKYFHLLDLMDKRFKQAFTPLLLEVIAQGQEENTMRVTYPEETVTILLHSIDALFDTLFLRESPEVSRRKANIVQGMIENLLNMDQGVLRLVECI